MTKMMPLVAAAGLMGAASATLAVTPAAAQRVSAQVFQAPVARIGYDQVSVGRPGLTASYYWQLFGAQTFGTSYTFGGAAFAVTPGSPANSIGGSNPGGTPQSAAPFVVATTAPYITMTGQTSQVYGFDESMTRGLVPFRPTFGTISLPGTVLGLELYSPTAQSILLGINGEDFGTLNLRANEAAFYAFDNLGQNNVFGRYDGITLQFMSSFSDLRITSVVSGVPEPATWAMMIVGFGVAGASLRRRKVNHRVQFT